MADAKDTAEEVGVWVQLGSTLVLVGFTTYLRIRALMREDGVTDGQMAAADAEYVRRRAQAKKEQQV